MASADPRAAPAPRALGMLIEPVYRAVVAHRNRAFDAGRGVVNIGVPVISVGNLSVGGSGKTPMVMRIVEWLLDDGRRPAIAMRGYKARAGEPSDEEAEYRERFPGLPIVAQPNRAAGLAPLAAARSIDCVVLDDGFQHRRIARALDIVLIDSARDPFHDRCLPAGWLREPVASLARADLVVLTHIEIVSDAARSALREAVRSVTGRPPEGEARHVWVGLSGRTAPRGVAELVGRRVVVACAIGNPSAFVGAARAAGADVAAVVERRDHHHWNDSDARELARLARVHGSGAGGDAMVLTTEKDWVKLRRLDEGALPREIVRPRLRLEFDAGEAPIREKILAAARADRL